MESIGGYFGLQLRSGLHYHVDAIKLNTARNCLEYILREKKYRKVYIPFYTCEVMLETIQKLNMDYEFYPIDEQLDPIFDRELKSDETFIYTNYFGLKQNKVEQLSQKMGKNIIVDNAQAFFAKPINGIDTFYSARKFFGVADGAYLYSDTISCENFEQDRSSDRMSHLLKRVDSSAEDAYVEFRNNENTLTNKPIMRMSKLTNALLSSIDYENVRDIRRRNYNFFEKHLATKNLLSLNMLDEVPMVYPFRTKSENLRINLIDNQIYVPTYWQNVFRWTNENMVENLLAKQIIPLPIDHRYNESDLLRIIKILK